MKGQKSKAQGKGGMLGVLALKEREKSQSRFLEALRECGEVAEACRAVGISRRTPYSWAAKDERFTEEMVAAREDGRQVLLDEVRREIRRRAVVGYEEPVIFGGKMSMVKDPETGKKVPLKVRRFSDNLLMFYAKRLDPQFRDNFPANLYSTAPVNIIFNFAPRELQPRPVEMPPRGALPEAPEAPDLEGQRR